MSPADARAGVGGPPGGPRPESLPAEPVPAPTGHAAVPARDDIDGLADVIVELSGRPIDVWGVAALLESTGVRDRDAVERHQLADVFALARVVFERLGVRELADPGPRVIAPDVEEKLTFMGSARIWARGGFFFVPIGLQVVALVVIGYSQYASVHFHTEQASIVALAVGSSFLVTGGFVQALGYLGPLFEEPGKHMLTERVVYAVMAAGLLGAGLFDGLAYAVNALLHGYSTTQAQILAVYFILAAAQAVVNAALYMLKRYLAMTLTTVAALAVVAALTALTRISITHVHWIALGAWWIFELVWLAVVMRSRARRTAGPMRLAQLPRAAILVRRAWPYATYGSLYFTLLLTDRLVAWSAGNHPLPFWFSTPYELGLDAALVAAVLAIAFLELTVELFSHLLLPIGDRFPVGQVVEHNEALVSFWRRQLLTVLGLLGVGGAATFGLIELLRAVHALGALEPRLHEPATRWAFGAGFVGDTLVTVGLANCVFLFSLGRPWHVVRAIGVAVVASAVVGLSLTSFEPFYTAVLGLVAGGLMFASLSAVSAWRTLRRADYWTYTAW